MVKIAGYWLVPAHIQMVSPGTAGDCVVTFVGGYSITFPISADEFVVAARMVTPGFSKALPGRSPAPPSP